MLFQWHSSSQNTPTAVTCIAGTSLCLNLSNWQEGQFVHHPAKQAYMHRWCRCGESAGSWTFCTMQWFSTDDKSSLAQLLEDQGQHRWRWSSRVQIFKLVVDVSRWGLWLLSTSVCRSLPGVSIHNNLRYRQTTALPVFHGVCCLTPPRALHYSYHQLLDRKNKVVLLISLLLAYTARLLQFQISQIIRYSLLLLKWYWSY